MMQCNEYDQYPFKLWLLKITDFPYRVSKSLKFIYVLKGSLSISFTASSNILNENQVEIVNINEPYRLTSMDGDCIIAILGVARDYVVNYSDDIEGKIYNCSTNEFYESGAKAESIDEIKSIISGLIIGIMSKDECSLEHQTEILLARLADDFDDIKNLLEKTQSDFKSERFYRIIDYIRSNLTESISLENIEKQEFLSKEYLSREFTRYFDKSFKEIQGYYRVMESSRLLLDTSDSIEEISASAGFSSKRYFYKYFRQYYGCTPNEFRLNNQDMEYKNMLLSPIELDLVVEKLSKRASIFSPAASGKSNSDSEEFEYRISYNPGKKVSLSSGIPAEYLTSINIEVNISDYINENMNDFIPELIGWISKNRIKIGKITFKLNLELYIQVGKKEFLTEISALLMDAQEKSGYRFKTVFCIEV